VSREGDDLQSNRYYTPLVTAALLLLLRLLRDVCDVAG